MDRRINTLPKAQRGAMFPAFAITTPRWARTDLAQSNLMHATLTQALVESHSNHEATYGLSRSPAKVDRSCAKGPE